MLELYIYSFLLIQGWTVELNSTLPISYWLKIELYSTFIPAFIRNMADITNYHYIQYPPYDRHQDKFLLLPNINPPFLIPHIFIKTS